jgi:hypothetical protein
MATFETHTTKDGLFRSYYIKYRLADSPKKYIETFQENELEQAKAFFLKVNIKHPRVYRARTLTEQANAEERKRKGWINGRPPSEHQIWQIRKPDTSHCAICGRNVLFMDGVVSEERTTGVQFKKQTWVYCPVCWKHHQELCSDDFDYKALLEVGFGLKLQGGIN